MFTASTDTCLVCQQNLGIDLRLVDNARWDNQTDYFGRVWIERQASSNQAPDLLNVRDSSILPGGGLQISLKASDPDHDSLSFTLERGTDFAKIMDRGNGSAILELAPGDGVDLNCSYLLRVIACDGGNPSLCGAATLRANGLPHGIFLPLVIQN